MPTGIVIGVTEIAGVLTAVGLGIVGLIKSGHIKVGKNNDNGSKSKDFNLSTCEKKHEKLDETIMAWDKMAQTMILEQQDHKSTLKVHKEKLEEGSARMDKMQKEINSVDKGVAILLDRSGGDTRGKI